MHRWKCAQCGVWASRRKWQRKCGLELGLEDGQAFARQRKGGRAFNARGTVCVKAKGR